MGKFVFEQSKYNPSMYFNRKRNIRTLVHGDDFVSSLSRPAAKWFKERLEQRFEIKTKIIGAGHGEYREERALNRVKSVKNDGWEYEADQRHAEIIIKSLGMEEAKGVRTPGQDERAWEEENDKPIAAARANYLAMISNMQKRRYAEGCHSRP